MPAYRNRVWDGKIRLYNQRTKELPIGLFPYLNEFVQARDYHVIVDPAEYYGRPDAENEERIDLTDITLTAGDKLIKPRDYQLEAVNHAIAKERSVMLSPTASGKSLMIYLIIRHQLEQSDHKDILVIVPTTSLVEQLAKDFADYSRLDEGFDPDGLVHKIYGGKDKYLEKKITITTWQSIYKEPKGFYQRFSTVIGDECHHFKAKSLTKILENCTEAKYRYGFTGTLDGTDTHRLVLEGLFGQVRKVTTTKKLMQDKSVAQLDITLLQLKYDDPVRKMMAKYTYQEEIDFLVTHDKRNNFIKNLACSQDGNTLVLFNLVEKHGKPLFEAIKDKLKDTRRKVFFVSGEVDVEVRENIRSITEKEDGAIIVASLGTFSTGINIKNLHNIIFAAPSKSQIKVLQSIGRGLRIADNGQETKLFDIVDDMGWKKKANYTLNHAKERVSIYAKESFKYKVIEVPLHES